MKTIKNLYELTELINSSEDYPLEIVEAAAIETNGWQDLTGNEYEVCANKKNKLVLDENTGIAKVIDDIKYTYDVIFNDDNSSNNKGIHGSKDECMRWIESNRHDSSTYFGDYKGGTVSIVCDQTEETIYEEKLTKDYENNI